MQTVGSARHRLVALGYMMLGTVLVLGTLSGAEAARRHHRRERQDQDQTAGNEQPRRLHRRTRELHAQDQIQDRAQGQKQGQNQEQNQGQNQSETQDQNQNQVARTEPDRRRRHRRIRLQDQQQDQANHPQPAKPAEPSHVSAPAPSTVLPAPLNDSAAAGSQTGEFPYAIAQVIHDCRLQAVVLQNTPTNVVIQTVKPSQKQLVAIQGVGTATNDAAKKLNTTCPSDVPAGLGERLTTADQALNATREALVLLRPAFVTAYASLDDEQKAQLVALALANSQHGPDSGGGPANLPAAADPPAPAKTGATQTHVPFGCAQWASLLKSWPLGKMEVDPSLSDRERADLYELMATVYRATGHLATSCQAENALTPVARLDAEVTRIDMLRQCIDSIEPALAKFTALLDLEQKTRFNTALGITVQSQTGAKD